MCWMNLMNLFFPKQVQQCSFGVTPRHYGHWWKFVLHKEPISQQIVANTYDDYIDICGVMFGFKVHWNFQIWKTNSTLLGAIELNREETLLVAQALRGSLGMDDMD